MQSGLLQSLSLFDVRGYVIVAAIVICFLTSLVLTIALRRRYGLLENDLEQNATLPRFESLLLNQIAREAADAAERQSQTESAQPLNIQAIIENQFQQRLRPLLLGERFIRSSTGLVIILGLVGTFYGLSLSIGKLVGLLSADSGTADITQALTTGLTETLSGMSIAFTSSLVGIAAAIALTLLGVFLNVAEARTGLLLQIETYLDRALAERSTGARAAGTFDRSAPVGLSEAVSAFGESVAHLDSAVHGFEAALQNFAATTRDFREFNLHLKDNVQRMSLSFADFSETLKAQASRGPR